MFFCNKYIPRIYYPKNNWNRKKILYAENSSVVLLFPIKELKAGIKVIKIILKFKISVFCERCGIKMIVNCEIMTGPKSPGNNRYQD